MSQRVCAGSKSAGYEQRVGTGRRRTAAAVAIPPTTRWHDDSAPAPTT
jgi:hypothetical protein